MPHLSFITPAALALLLLLPLLWVFTLLAPRRVARWRFWGSLLLRSMLLSALVLALAGAQLVRPVKNLTTIFLIDGSDSVAPAQREQALRYVEDALRTMPGGSQAAVVVFGENALVERAPASLAALGRINSVPVATRTNIQDAIQLGLALLPADTQKRLVLLSDGGENSGRAADAARLAAVRGVPIDIVALPSQHGPDAMITSLDTPSVAREGQEIALNALLQSSFATSGRLQMFVDGQLLAEQDVTLQAGSSRVPLRVPSGQAGFRRLEVRLEAQGDSEPQNNRAAAFTDVQGPPRMLLIAGDPARAINLQNALTAAGVQVDLRTPDQAPATLAQLGDYAGVIIIDTPARAMPRVLLEVLPIYVRDLGRGLAMIGGTDSFGAGGYRRTPIEDALPVNLDPLDTTRQPDLALMMVIDRSGSMDEAGGTGGRTKLELAKEAVYQASLGLTEQDQIGLVVFDEAAETILPLQKLPSALQIEQSLSSFNSGGGTNIRPGLEQAAQALAATPAKIKHVILLTDGIAPGNYRDLIEQMSARGVTISTVAIGSDANRDLEQIASQGGGRYYHVQQAIDVPRIFLQETVIAAGRDIIEGQFTPQIALQTAAVRGLGGLPPLDGYNGTETKEAARTILVTPEGKPVLAQWQYGLGRAVAWTSDLQGKWARAWVQWDQFPRFVGGLADLLLPLPAAERLTLQSTNHGPQTALELIAEDSEGRPLNELTLEARLVAPDNQSRPLIFAQVGAGRYRTTTETTTPGVYLAQVAASRAGGPIGVVSSGVVVSYSPEYGASRENLAVLRDLAASTGGRIDAPADQAFAPTAQVVGSVEEIALQLLWLVLLLWPLDIALRRLFLRLSEFAPSLAALRPRRAVYTLPAPSDTLARLSAAKRRAARSPGPASRSVEPPTSVPALNPDQRAPAAVPEPPPEPAPESQPLGDQQVARLLAAKRRARGKK